MTAATIERLRLAGASFEPGTVDTEAREVTCVFLSGTPIRRIDPFGEPFELAFDPDGADLSRLNAGVAPILDSHFDRPLDNQLGIVTKAWRDGERFLARLRFSASERVEPIWRDILAGTMRGISAGFSVSEYAEEKDNQGRRVRMVAKRWQPVEISLVTVPADPGAMTLAMSPEQIGDDMSTSTQTGAPSAEQARATEILNIAKLGKLDLDTVQQHISAGTTVEAFRALTLEHLARQSEKNPTVAHHSTFVMRDEAETVKTAMSEALLARATGTAPADAGREWYGRRVSDMARELMRMHGFRASGSDSQIVNETLLATTSDFPNLLSGLAGKMLLDSYRLAESGIKAIARKSSAPDFKTKYVLRRGEFPALQEVAEHGEFKAGAIGEGKESYSLKTFGRIFGISRQALVNDDLGSFSDMAFAIGQAAADFEAGYFVSLLTANAGAGPVMSDSYNLFDTVNHGNSGSGAINVTSLDTARAAMRTQKGVDGVTVIDCRPKFLVVPASRETVAQQYVSAITPADSSKVNPFQSQLVVIAEPRLDSISDARWYLFADPAVIPAMEYSYLNGTEGPEIQQRVGFEVDGLEVKARLDFGAAAVDWRACYISTGS